MVENRDGEDSERGSIDTELGFTKWGNEWVLATRRAFYDNTQYGNVYSFVRAEDVTPLLQESRRVRIEAPEHFPEIVKALQAAAEKPRPKAHGKDATDRGQPILPERPGIGSGRFHFLRSDRHEPQPLRRRSEPARPFSMTETYGAIYAQGL